MNTKKILLSIIIALAFLTTFWVYFGRDGHRRNVIISAGRIETRISPTPGFDGEAAPEKPEEVYVDSQRMLSLRESPQPVLAMPSPVPADSLPPSSVVRPRHPVQGESAIQRSVPQQSVPKTPPVVLPPEEISPVKLCGGEPISECLDCDFTHLDFALLILDILRLKRADKPERAFETLEAHEIEPGGGWAKSDPEKHMTPEEMEEVRCSISLAAEDGSIPVGSSVVTTAMNRFCADLEVSIKSMRDSGVAKGGHTGGDAIPPAESGYQGGTDGITSSAF